MIAGLEEPSAGQILINDRVVNDIPPKDRDLAMVFQNYALYPHLTVHDNLAFALRMRRVAEPEVATRVNEAAELLGLGDMLDRLPKTLSGGQRQRVALGRAIVRRPKVFLFDEPLSNLDAKMRASMRAEIVRLHALLGATMIYVTHDQTEAMTMGDRICVMNEGQVMQVAAPLDLYRQPANRFTASFIGSPSMNFFPGTAKSEPDGAAFHSQHGALRFRFPTGDAPVKDGPVILGVRPEHLTLAAGAATPDPDTIPGTVELVERLGAEALVHLTIDQLPAIARLPGDVALGRGDHVHLAAPPAAWHFFDAATSQRIPR
jgi:multiple sugar transport system ATP-binding protein